MRDQWEPVPYERKPRLLLFKGRWFAMVANCTKRDRMLAMNYCIRRNIKEGRI